MSVSTDTLCWSGRSWRGVLHSWAFFAAIPAGVLLIVFAGGAAGRTAASIYTVTLLLVFGTSASYHRLAQSPRARRIMQRLDHTMIYLLIAGTYAPLCLVALPMRWGIPLLATVTAIGVVGMVIKLSGARRLQMARVCALSDHGLGRRRRGTGAGRLADRSSAGADRRWRHRLHGRLPGAAAEAPRPVAPIRSGTTRCGTASPCWRRSCTSVRSPASLRERPGMPAVRPLHRRRLECRRDAENGRRLDLDRRSRRRTATTGPDEPADRAAAETPLHGSTRRSPGVVSTHPGRRSMPVWATRAARRPTSVSTACRGGRCGTRSPARSTTTTGIGTTGSRSRPTSTGAAAAVRARSGGVSMIARHRCCPGRSPPASRYRSTGWSKLGSSGRHRRPRSRCGSCSEPAASVARHSRLLPILRRLLDRAEVWPFTTGLRRAGAAARVRRRRSLAELVRRGSRPAWCVMPPRSPARHRRSPPPMRGGALPSWFTPSLVDDRTPVVREEGWVLARARVTTRGSGSGDSTRVTRQPIGRSAMTAGCRSTPLPRPSRRFPPLRLLVASSSLPLQRRSTRGEPDDRSPDDDCRRDRTDDDAGADDHRAVDDDEHRRSTARRARRRRCRSSHASR